MGIEGILGVGAGDRASGVSVCWNSARIVEGFRPGVAYLDARTAVREHTCKRCLERVVAGMGAGGDQLLCAKATDWASCAVEPGVGRESRTGAGIGVGKGDAWQPDGLGADVGCIRVKLAELSLHPKRPRLKIAVAEPAIYACQIKWREL